MALYYPRSYAVIVIGAAMVSLTVAGISDAAHGAGTVGTSLAGTYGHLTLNANGSYSYAADNTAAISTPEYAVPLRGRTPTLADLEPVLLPVTPPEAPSAAARG